MAAAPAGGPSTSSTTWTASAKTDEEHARTCNCPRTRTREPHRHQHQVPPWASLATGAVSGLASCLLLQPMDLLKTRLQQESRRQGQRQRQHMAESRTARLLRTAHDIWAAEGARGFWRGTAPTVARNVPGVAVYFYGVSELRAAVACRRVPFLSQQQRDHVVAAPGGTPASPLAKLSTAGNLLTGAVARVAVGFLLAPVTVVKAKMESSAARADPASYATLRSSLAYIYSTQGGVRALYQGFGATALRDAPYAGIYLALYEWSKVTLSRSAACREQLAWTASASGLLAGALATLLTHPFDIIKTRIQTQQQQPHIRSTLGMARRILAHDGLQAFADGLGLRCARKAASSAIAWSIFELGTRAWLDAAAADADPPGRRR
ncbi:mitochondrial carrier [Tilletiaria anomala UBC 951]|uniref:Mitochondrial carrier n=1 Tax=Tilletiaria anomala (strain ATCC 24038 / CBS 436.72 / UBC 951) TaxID=1037660 RepID=A0A066VWG5_TILAU|nr:mitochondrial carrier [Tilletiaria anomala UBC 951]KDN42850.1 mitochondrial carrier [Tilletiaria anomala UBC 951]